MAAMPQSRNESARRALRLLIIGTILGILVGGLSVAADLYATRRATPPPAAAGAAAATPTLGPIGSPATATRGTGTPATASPAVDPIVASALRQIALTNGQLAFSVAVLKGQVRRYQPIDTGAVSTTLRSMSATATYGSSVVGNLAGWTDAGSLRAEIGRLYTEVEAITASGLAASLANPTAYRTAASQMVVLLATLPSIQAEVATLAQSGQIDLPMSTTASAPP